MKTYAMGIALTILFPVLLSFERRVFYFSKWPAVFVSILPTATVFIIWDIIAVTRGHWNFSPGHVFGLKLFGLPFEEILFFFCIPFSCIFILECVSYFVKPRRVNIPRFIFFSLAIAVVIAGILAWPREYTATVCIATGFFFAMCGTIHYRVVNEVNFWISMLIILIPFAIVNGFLTAIPVVVYNPDHITGIRLGTIPIEDAVYNLVLIGSALMTYRSITLRSGKQ
ncbi:MAG TPA: lycopene cyclase domain-containing protein [Spirochaetota bacterium]|nr:lycopene cyclase domain-containing protein [Spirochaetota bacterium]